MTPRYAARARNDLAEIFRFTAIHHPAALAGLMARIRQIEAQIGRWPESAPIVEDTADVRMVPLLRYPFKLFYRVRAGQVEIISIHHAARDPRP